MNIYLAEDRGQVARNIILISEERFPDWEASLSPRGKAAVAAASFRGKPNTSAVLHHAEAEAWSVAVGTGNASDELWQLASLPQQLPAGTYRIDGILPDASALGWALGQYRFDRYFTENEPEGPRVLLTETAALATDAGRLANAQSIVRDMVNTPAEDMGPADLEAATRAAATQFGASVNVTVGDALLTENYPAIHAVGRAAAPGREPRLIRLDWGKSAAPHLILVGKGVCFDSGGLDIKPASGMRLMKKDMGGAAHALALAHLIMEADLPVRLTLLIAAVENSVSANAFRPGDVIATRKGLSIEIHNTDAEGRLVLCDALTAACEDRPELIIDFATLTGAARVALGPDLPAMMTNDDDLADAISKKGTEVGDPVWRLPLWPEYMKMLKSELADISNAANGGFAGAITAGLYLSRFVDEDRQWVHFDTFAWMPTAKPGRPKGGEALGLRACFAMIRERFGAK